MTKSRTANVKVEFVQRSVILHQEAHRSAEKPRCKVSQSNCIGRGNASPGATVNPILGSKARQALATDRSRSIHQPRIHGEADPSSNLRDPERLRQDETRSPSGPRTVSFKAKEWGICLDTVRKRRSIDHRSRLEGTRSISQGGRCEVAARKL